MKILAIETSCDETAIALMECEGNLPQPTFKVLGNTLVSQIQIHKEYGGVFPMLAKREHLKNLPIVLEQTLRESSERSERRKPQVSETDDIDIIAVTVGPGLEPALWTGIEFAEELGRKWGKPVAPTNHMEGHLWSVLYQDGNPNDQIPNPKIEFPAIALLVSGGHTELVLVEAFDKYRILGRTKDDAVGEAFDKVARLLGLPYPGGPKISELAEIARKRNSDFRASRTAMAGVERASSAEDDSALRKSTFRFPRPMMNTKDYDFSYSGLKTSVLYALKKVPEINDDISADVAKEFEEAAIEPLVEKTRRALDEFGARSIVLGGGVAANRYLREKLAILSVETGADLRLPLPELTTDNAIMIGIAAYVRALTNRLTPVEKIEAKGNLDLVS